MQFFLDTQNNTRDIGCNPIEDAAVAVLPDGPCSQNNGVQSFSNQTINFSINIHPPLKGEAKVCRLNICITLNQT